MSRSSPKTIVFRMLKLRLYSEKEIRDRLKKKQIEPQVIDDTVRYFKDLEFIDDRKFAKQWIVSRLMKPFGLSRIQFELKVKGIDDDVIAEEFAAAGKNFLEDEVVLKLAQKRASVYHRIPKEKVKQRVYGYLVRRGFGSYAIGKAIREI